jgi:hypothetical protein
MKFQEGYAYHIKDAYFDKVQDDKLMQNKENGTYRPTYLCMEDPKNKGLLWVVPMSTKIAKYKAIYDKQVAKYGKCLTIVLGEFDGRKSAFLLQNMFPITDQYIDHIHTRNGNPVPIKHSIAQEVHSNMQQLHQLIRKGKTVVFPDIKRLENLMLEELHQIHTASQEAAPSVTENTTSTMSSIKDQITAAQVKADQHNSNQSQKK